jgi:cytochrome c oxidase subunit 2
MLQNLFGSAAALASGETVVVDEAYIRESILTPRAKIVAGFQPIMPTFQGLVSEEGLLELIEYVKSLKTETPGPSPRPATQAPAPGEATPARPAARN